MSYKPSQEPREIRHAVAIDSAMGSILPRPVLSPVWVAYGWPFFCLFGNRDHMAAVGWLLLPLGVRLWRVLGAEQRQLEFNVEAQAIVPPRSSVLRGFMLLPTKASVQEPRNQAALQMPALYGSSLSHEDVLVVFLLCLVAFLALALICVWTDRSTRQVMVQGPRFSWSLFTPKDPASFFAPAVLWAFPTGRPRTPFPGPNGHHKEIVLEALV